MMNTLFLGLPIIVVCLTLQTALLIAATRYYFRHARLLETDSFWSSMLVVIGVMLLLLMGNIAQIGIWGLLFMLLDEFDHFREAFYHSAVNFSTLGYGDVVMSNEHRILGPIEAINGVLMIGVSTAALMGALRDVAQRALKAQGEKSR